MCKNGQRDHTVSLSRGCLPWPGLVEDEKREGVLDGVPIADVIQRHSTDQRMMSSNAVDGLLHLAMSTVPALHGIRGRGKNGIIEEGERLLEVWAEKLLQGFPHRFEASDSRSQLAELG